MSNEKFLGRGNYGMCYLTEDGAVKKVYIDKMPQTVYNGLGIKNDTYVFPDKVDEIEDIAYMRYVPNAKPFYAGPNCANPKFEVFLAAIEKVYQDTYLLSQNNLRLKDCWYRNILYGDDKLTIVDTDLYKKCHILINPQHRNIKDLNLGLLSCITLRDDDNEFIKQILCDKRGLLELYKQTFTINSDNETIGLFLRSLKKVLEDNEEIRDLSEYRKAIRKRIK